MSETLTLNTTLTKDERGCWGSGLGFQGERGQFTWRWESKCLVNKCLLGQAETMGHRVDPDR